MGKIAVEKKSKINRMDVEKPQQIIKKKVTKLRQTMNIEKKQQQKQKKQQKTQTKQINKSEIYKDFNKALTNTLQKPTNVSKGKKKRFEKKYKMLKKKMLDKLMKEKEKQQKAPETFIWDELKNDLSQIDEENRKILEQKQIEMEQQKKRGTAPHLRNKLIQQDRQKMKQVLQIQQFQQNPLATIRMHLQNTYK